MKTTALIFGCTLALAAQDLTPEQQAKLDAAKKKMDELHMTLSNQTFEFVGGQMLGGSTVKGAPYSAEAVNESTQVLADGTRIVNKTSSMLYRDSDGRERREETIAKLGPWNSSGTPAKAIFISDPVAKVNYSLDEKTHTATKSPGGLPAVGRIMTQGALPGGGIVSAGGHGAVTIARAERVESRNGEVQVFRMESNGSTTTASAPKIENLGTQMVEGVSAEGTRETITIPAGQIGNDRELKIVSERWYSPELKVTVMSKHSDPRTGETVYKLTNINRSEPQRSLFEVPADYSVEEPKLKMIRKDDNE
jgi:hypothetical protein